MVTEIVKIAPTDPDFSNKIESAAEIIKHGGLVVFPTETVYGLGADATNPSAAQKIYAAKGRPSDNPLIIHVARPEDAENLINALKNNFEGYEELHSFLKSAPKFGNNIPEVDNEAAEIAAKISDMVSSHKNYLGNPFRADWASPTTHLTYGYWVAATPDGRVAREQLNYGVDPLYGEASGGMGFRMLSNMHLPFEKMGGGYASHLGVDPKFFTAPDNQGKGADFATRIVKPLFFNDAMKGRISPFYLYVNVTTPETLRKVLAEPKKYAPSGVYIMRIHGTFVNFLDLSPEIQQDIIKRLDLASTTI